MPLGDYMAGCAFFALTTGPTVAAAVLITRRRLTHLTGVDALLACAVLTIAGLLAVHLLPGLTGVLSRETAAATALALLAGTVLLCRGREPGALELRTPPLGWVAVTGVGLVTAWCAAAAWVGTVIPSTDVDSLTFHLPNMLKWIQTGSVWRTDEFVPLLANGNYPQNGGVIGLAVVLPFESDAFVRVLGLPFAAITGLALYALGRDAGAPASTTALFAAAFVAIPVFFLSAFEGAKTDAVMLAMLGSGTFFLCRFAVDGKRSSLVLGALGLGIAFGTKWYAVWSVAVILAGVGGRAGGTPGRPAAAWRRRCCRGRDHRARGGRVDAAQRDRVGEPDLSECGAPGRGHAVRRAARLRARVRRLHARSLCR